VTCWRVPNLVVTVVVGGGVCDTMKLHNVTFVVADETSLSNNATCAPFAGHCRTVLFVVEQPLNSATHCCYIYGSLMGSDGTVSTSQ